MGDLGLGSAAALGHVDQQGSLQVHLVEHVLEAFGIRVAHKVQMEVHVCSGWPQRHEHISEKRECAKNVLQSARIRPLSLS